MGGPDGLDLLLKHRQVGVGRTQFRPKVAPSTLSVPTTNAAHTILFLLTVLVLLSIWVTSLGLLSVWVGATVLVVVALSWSGTNVLLSIRVRASGWRDHAVGRRWVGGLLRSRLIPIQSVDTCARGMDKSLTRSYGSNDRSV